jgi:hypothetical protein
MRLLKYTFSILWLMADSFWKAFRSLRSGLLDFGENHAAFQAVRGDQFIFEPTFRAYFHNRNSDPEKGLISLFLAGNLEEKGTEEKRTDLFSSAKRHQNLTPWNHVLNYQINW